MLISCKRDLENQLRLPGPCSCWMKGGFAKTRLPSCTHQLGLAGVRLRSPAVPRSVTANIACDPGRCYDGGWIKGIGQPEMIGRDRSRVRAAF